MFFLGNDAALSVELALELAVPERRCSFVTQVSGKVRVSVRDAATAPSSDQCHHES